MREVYNKWYELLEDSVQNKTIVIYDGSRKPYRSLASHMSDKVDAMFVDWYSDAVQRFLEVQFGQTAFSFMLVENEKVYAGQHAVREFLERLQDSSVISEIGYSTYPIISKPVGLVFHRREPASLNGIYKLEEDAKKALQRLDEDA